MHLYIKEHRPVVSSSRWSSVVITAEIETELVETVLTGIADVDVEVKRKDKE